MTYRILEGDASARLRDLEPASVQTVVTSPPYKRINTKMAKAVRLAP